MIANLFNEESSAARCLALIERCAPKFMRIGGSMHNGTPQCGNRLTKANKARAIKMALTGRYFQREIAELVGCTQAGLSKILRERGIHMRKLGRAGR